MSGAVSYAGRAKSAQTAERPDLWSGLVGCWLPILGPTDQTIPEISRRATSAIADGVETDDWLVVDGVRCVALNGGHGTSGTQERFDQIQGLPSDLFSGDFTISAYVNPDSPSATATIFGRGASDAFLFRIVTTSSRVIVEIDNSQNKFASAWTDQEWQTITARRSGSAVNVWTDGVLNVNTKTETGDGSSTDAASIGTEESGKGVGGWVGASASVAIWDRALPAPQIEALAADPYILARPRLRRAIWLPSPPGPPSGGSLDYSGGNRVGYGAGRRVVFAGGARLGYNG